MSNSIPPKKVVLIENFLSDFISARLPLYNFLKQQGFDVYAVFPEEAIKDDLSQLDVKYFTYKLSRNSLNPLVILKNIKSLKQVLNAHKFDVVHTFRFHPNLYGNIVSRLTNQKNIVNHVTGLGICFSKRGVKYLISRLVYSIVLQFNILLSNKVIAQNTEDYRFLKKFIGAKRKVHLVKGSGVNTDFFNPDLIPLESIQKIQESLGLSKQYVTISFVSRLINEKGILELLKAVKKINDIERRVTLLIVGWVDDKNPSAIDMKIIEEYKNDDSVIFLGKRSDIRELLCVSDIFALPSYYREGIPRSILEAMSMRKPIITTDMPGCNLTVEQEKNGILVKPKSEEDIEKAILYFIQNKKLINDFGDKSRERILNEFSNEIVFNEVLDIYKELLSK